MTISQMLVWQIMAPFPVNNLIQGIVESVLCSGMGRSEICGTLTRCRYKEGRLKCFSFRADHLRLPRYADRACRASNVTFKLWNYMIDFDIGVASQATYIIKRIDNDYFDEDGG